MQGNRSQLDDFIQEYSKGSVSLLSDDDLFKKLSLAGDDCDDFLVAFGERFNVDMTELLWYFHYEEEGMLTPAAFFFKPPYLRVKRIPITMKLLQAAILSRKWPIQYPEHVLPKRRWDVIATYFFFAALLVLITVWFISNKTR